MNDVLKETEKKKVFKRGLFIHSKKRCLVVVSIIIAVVALLFGGGAFYYAWKQQASMQSELQEIGNRTIKVEPTPTSVSNSN